MTRNDLMTVFSGSFTEGFADRIAAQVIREGCVELLYEVAVAPYEELPAAVRHKVRFRSAYVLERIFFGRPDLFEPCVAAFCRKDFPACTDPSARRHFAKIMVRLLPSHWLRTDELDRIAECAAQWILEPETKVSVKVWAVEILKCCRGRVGWIAETWDDLLEALALDATPGIESRLRKSWK